MDKKTLKKKRKLQERIDNLEAEMLHQLQKKNSHTPEISIGEYQRKIEQSRKQMASL